MIDRFDKSVIGISDANTNIEVKLNRNQEINTTQERNGNEIGIRIEVTMGGFQWALRVCNIEPNTLVHS